MFFFPFLKHCPCMLMFLLFTLFFTSTEAYDPLDPNGNITITWDVVSLTSDGYVAVVTINNFQQYRHITAPGWFVGWSWVEKEIIWAVVGGEATDQGDCSEFTETFPHCCKKDPTIIDLRPGTPYNKQFANCCKGGVLRTWAQDPPNAVAAFQVSVGRAGNNKTAIIAPQNFTLKTPGPGYTCNQPKIAELTEFTSPNERRVTEAILTWKVTCTYSQFLVQKPPNCCVSLSSFYSENIVPCPNCSCACQDNSFQSGSCIDSSNSSNLASIVNSPGEKGVEPLVECTRHMCPIKVHWHIKYNYYEYWRVKITVFNFNYRKNYSDWNVVVQHPNFDKLTQIFSYNYKSLAPYGSTNDTAMLWGVKFFNDVLMQAGPNGNVQSELLFRKNKSSFSFRSGWGFPEKIYFNGDECSMPPPDAYPRLPNGCSTQEVSLLALMMTSFILLVLCTYA